MKHKLFLLVLWAIACLSSACSDDDNDRATLSFGRAYYVLQAQANLEVDLRASSPVENALTVKINVSGSAVEGEDYSISAKEFVFQPGEDIAKITIIPLNNYTEEREIKLSVEPVTGFSLWNNKSTIIPIEPKEVLICSFSKSWVELEAMYKAGVEVKGSVSGKFNSIVDLHLPFEIVADGTTAIEGKHYTIEGDAREFVIPAGKNKAEIQLNFLEREIGKDKITFRLILPDDTYRYGNYADMQVQIVGPLSFEKLAGKWEYKTFASETAIRDILGTDPDFATDLDELPTANSSAGTIEFIEGAEEGKGQMISNLTGDLANYFRNCEIEFSDPEYRYLGDLNTSAWVSNAYFDPVNAYFSASASDERSAKVGLRLLDGGETLEVRIEDCEPQDFLQLIFMFEMQELTPIVFHFTRIE
ncbi:Calx-beta domain-containing protein [Butyricimonas sp. Marseille-P3923]|uniref:Calx-beta domain-containing protein n=1 Tax=Butyricimonas sp. Marseille-P3923 TaxID=1987504 RepID=UPI000C07A39D|nr:Calx-beta domain-containing protein [Butyricimonas sp. Marseille-P3923]